ncbi:hypothetical protein FG05_35023 [Fusarium graminearum]|nr:hypothetical protein FG05_35023 [Fusarium graminearum]
MFDRDVKALSAAGLASTSIAFYQAPIIATPSITTTNNHIYTHG